MLYYIISYHIFLYFILFYVFIIYNIYIILLCNNFLFGGMTRNVIQPEFIDLGLTLIIFRLIVSDFVHPNPSHFISLNDH